MAGAKPRTGLLGRIGNLILLQSIFVFAAVALALFYPSRDEPATDETARYQQLVRTVGDQLASALEARPTAGGIEVPAGTSSRGEPEEIGPACLLSFSGGTLKPVLAIRDGKSLTIDADLPEGLSACYDASVAHVTASETRGFLLSNICSSTKAICYYRPAVATSDSLVFVALVDHHLLISARDEIRYLLLVLFLASTLVSLLMVHLIGKKLRQPLAQVARAIEKTSQGEVYYQTAAEGDEELAALSASANRLSEALYSSRKQVTRVSTRLKEVNESLAQAQQFLAKLLESSPLCIVVADNAGGILIFNNEASTLFEISREEALHRNVRDLFNLTPGAEAGAATGEFEAVGRRGSDQSFPVYVISSPLVDGEGETWAQLYIVRDISESKSFQEMMIRLDRYSTRGEMAGEIAHEINNYLAVLSGNVELMPLLLKRGDQEKITRKLDLMKTTVERIATFTDGLMCGGDEELRLEPCNLNQVIENVIAFLKPQNRYDTVEITTSLSLELPLVYADSGQVQQLLVNIINNAADSLMGTRKSGHIHVRTLQAKRETGPVARLEIQDDGEGVQADKVPHLFGKRFTTKRRGHGIGLVTCRKIVEAHSGEIGYEFRDGALFWIEIPLAPKAGQNADQAGQAERVPSGI